LKISYHTTESKLKMEIWILAALGIVSLLRGIWMLGGGGKGWYVSSDAYAGFTYAQIPVGICFICLAIAAATHLELFAGVGVGFGVVGLLFNFLQPSFLKPAWLKGLEREHGDIINLLIEDANRMGLEVWEKRVETQANLDAWAAEVRHKKNGLKIRGLIR
jgi:hypothetical protein